MVKVLKPIELHYISLLQVLYPKYVYKSELLFKLTSKTRYLNLGQNLNFFFGTREDI